MKFHLNKKTIRRVGEASLFMLMEAASAGEPVQVASAEEGYLDELPVVLSVTRLAQSLADTPGAVTIIDRETIRRSGAREVTDVLRLVPGFIVMRVGNGANPTAYYHAAMDDNGRQMQVFVDGRSVYSSLYLGDTHRGLSTLVLEDIERIEVLRGSNSAAYGANAYLGVINIVTRNAADTRGVLTSVAVGNQGVIDNVARIGWGNEDASFRLTTSRRSDTGTNAFQEKPTTYNLSYDDKAVSQLHFRGDMRLSGTDDLRISAGTTTLSSGLGNTTNVLGNLYRNEETDVSYFQGVWSRQLSAYESVSMSASVDNENYSDDRFVTFLGANIKIGTSGKAERHNFEFSHSLQPSESVRTVWGVNWRREAVTAPLLFNKLDAQTQQQMRLFGNLEWRPGQNWVVNAGGLLEHNSEVAGSFSPRLMVNYHFLPEHTIRIGATKASRTPTVFELRANRGIYHPLTGTLLLNQTLSTGEVKSEKISSREIGYLGEFNSVGLLVDVRAFQEHLTDITAGFPYQLTPAITTGTFNSDLHMDIRGIEQQWRWKRGGTTELMFGHAYTKILSENPSLLLRAPRISYSLAWFQKLPADFDFSLMYAHVQEMSMTDMAARLPAYGQIDARLAYPFRMGQTRAEVSVTSQALNGAHLENKNNVFVSRRTFATLRLEF